MARHRPSGWIYSDTNKTTTRATDLEPGAARCSHKCKELAGEVEIDRVFVSGGVPIDVEHLARQLRLDLKRAGIDRPQLFENNDKRQQVRAHDLRSTFVVVAEANGRSEAWITTRTGHKSSRMVAASPAVPEGSGTCSRLGGNP